MATKTHRTPVGALRAPDKECIKFVTISYDRSRDSFSGVIVYDILDGAGDPMGETPEALDQALADKVAELVLGTE